MHLLRDPRLLTAAFRLGNASWEHSLALAKPPDNMEVLVWPQDSSKHLFYLQESSISMRRSKRKHLLDYIDRLSGMVTAKALHGHGTGYEPQWEGKTVVEREIVVLDGLRKVTEAVRDESA